MRKIILKIQAIFLSLLLTALLIPITGLVLPADAENLSKAIEVGTDKDFETIGEALLFVQNSEVTEPTDYVITVCAGTYSEAAVIIQQENKNIILRGEDEDNAGEVIITGGYFTEYAGLSDTEGTPVFACAAIDGCARADGEEGIILQNITFQPLSGNAAIVSCNLSAKDNCSAHNVLIADCMFTGTLDAADTRSTVGVKASDQTNLALYGCVYDTMHSMVQGGITEIIVDSCRIINTDFGIESDSFTKYITVENADMSDCNNSCIVADSMNSDGYIDISDSVLGSAGTDADSGILVLRGELCSAVSITESDIASGKIVNLTADNAALAGCGLDFNSNYWRAAQNSQLPDFSEIFDGFTSDGELINLKTYPESWALNEDFSLYNDSCSVTGAHEWGEWQTIAPATCLENGVRQHLCVNPHCDLSYPAPVEGGEITAPGEHNYSEWAQYTAPTCCKAGTERRYCSRSGCDAYEEREIAATGEHVYGDWVQYSFPTCQAPGEQRCYCTEPDCGAYLKRTENALGKNHAMSDWEIIQAPTCVTPGIRQRVCVIAGCDYSEQTEILDNDAHTYASPVVFSVPCCCCAGETEEICIYCGKTVFHEYGAKTDKHTWSEWTTTKAATSSAEGEMVRRCTVYGCGVQDVKSIAKVPAPSFLQRILDFFRSLFSFLK